MATKIAVTDQFLSKLVQTKSVRSKFKKLDRINQQIKNRPTGCCGRGASADSLSKALGQVRNIVMSLSPADAAELKRLLGLQADVKLVSVTGFGAKLVRKEV